MGPAWLEHRASGGLGIYLSAALSYPVTQCRTLASDSILVYQSSTFNFVPITAIDALTVDFVSSVSALPIIERSLMTVDTQGFASRSWSIDLHSTI